MREKKERTSKKLPKQSTKELNIEMKDRLLKPAHQGWKREVTMGVKETTLDPDTYDVLEEKEVVTSVCYWPPWSGSSVITDDNKLKGAQKIKNIQELNAYLEMKQDRILTIHNFSFKKVILGCQDGFEIIRRTKKAIELQKLC